MNGKEKEVVGSGHWRSRRRRVISMAAAVVLLLAQGCATPRTPIKHTVPDGRTGHYRIEYQVKGAQPLQKKEGYYEIDFDDSGKFTTSSEIEAGVATDLYHFRGPDGRLRQIHHTRVVNMYQGREQNFDGSGRQTKDRPWIEFDIK